MEVGGGGVGGRRRLSSRETSPDRVRLMGYSQHHHHHHQRFIRPLRKVQIIYYLSRNGQLEHPHFMELPYLPNQHLRLKDVTDRLTLLRGKGMPSLFSWSCKRSYKNGYVWNDLAENDIIYPADGIEYVLKGSEIIPGTYERYQHPAAANRQPKPLAISHHHSSSSSRQQHVDSEDEEDGEIEEEIEEVIEHEEAKCGGHAAGSNTSKVPDCYTCSRGVSTDELRRVKNRPRARVQDLHGHSPTELPLDDASPPSSSSSDKPPAAVTVGEGPGGSTSQRFEDGDPVAEPGLSRNSVLLHLISCGSGAVKGRSGTTGAGAGSFLKSAAGAVVAAASSPLGGGRRSSGGLQRGLVSRLASRAVEDDLRCVSEDLRFGHPLLEDKEYFSGSIVEGTRGPPEPSLKKSSSYNEERSSKLGIEEAVKLETREEREGGVKAKCIPGRRKASGSKQQQQQVKKGS